MKRCPKCSARNDDSAQTCTLCNTRLPGANSEAFELEPRKWDGTKQRRRGEGMGTGSNDAEAAAIPAAPSPPSGNPSPLEPRTSNEVRHFLVPPVGEPVRINPSARSVVFGRDEGCTVRIGSTKVSRRHAELRWKGERLVLHDLNSQNGSYVNDVQLVGERPLDDGDAIRFGDFVTTYRKLEPGENEDDLRTPGNETSVMETIQMEVLAAAGSTPVNNAALSGDAVFLPISEVLKRLLALHAHGTLHLDLNGLKGSMKVVDGHPVEGDYAGLEGPPAITAMASLTKGKFHFDSDKNAPPPKPVAAAPRAAGAGTPRPPGPVPPTGGHPAGAPRPARPVDAPTDKFPAPQPRPQAPGAPARPAPRPGPPPAPRSGP
jgi:pSer/pThr/pTyr-binding forkhead associated (FHA) protein